MEKGDTKGGICSGQWRYIQNKHFAEKAKVNDSSAIMETDILATVLLCKPWTLLIP